MESAPVRASEKLARVLLVEDEGIIARGVGLMLENLGYAVAGVASSGAQAFALAARESIDLVLMDIRLKGDVDGIETAHQLRARYRLPIVYLTAYADDDTLERAGATEPFGFITKPFTAVDVKLAVSIALRRHRLHRKVEERGAWLNCILASIAEAVVTGDGENRILLLNEGAEKMIGVPNHEAVGRTLDEVVKIVSPDGEPQSPRNLLASIGTGTSLFFAGSLLRPDHTERQVLASFGALKPEAGGGTVLVMRDITELWKTGQDLQQANDLLTASNQRLTSLSHSLSHDLKEPLRSVRLYSQLMTAEDESRAENWREYLKEISEGCQRMDGVITSLLEYFSASGLSDAHAECVDASDPFRVVLSNLHAAIQLSGAQIVASGLPTVCVHPTALLLIFQNLLSNSIKYSGGRIPRIFVSASQEDQFWRFTVEDNGSGFAPHEAERIFDLFQRAHSRETAGSGIGLATCRKLVEQHHGKIWAESTPGTGSRFHFTIPVHTEGRTGRLAAGASAGT